MSRRLYIAIIFLILAVCACVGICALADPKSDVEFGEVTFSEVYAKNDKIVIPKMSAESDGQQYPTESKVIFPSGATYKAESFILTETGVYKVIYSCEIDGKYYQTEETFEVKNTANDLFTVTKGSVKFGQADISPELYGAQFDGQLGMEVFYNNIIDLSKSTKNDLMIELMATAHTMEVSDFSEFYITLTDIYDATNTVTIKIHCAKTNGYGFSFAKARACDKNWVGIEKGVPQFTSDTGGTVLNHSFGSWNFSVNNSIQLYWDNADLSLYGKNNTGSVAEICDFNDESYITRLWGGFTTGEVQLSVKIGDVAGEPRYVIKSINGVSFSAENPVDSIAPSIQIDMPSDTTPDAVVGRAFKVFSAAAKDNLSIKDFTTKVYYNYDNGNFVEYSVLDDYFVPDCSGKYTIVYTAEDHAGNRTEKKVEVMAYDSLPQLNIAFSGEDTEVRHVGDEIALQEYVISGGSGVHEVKFYYKKGNDRTEIKTETLFFADAGKYEIIGEVTDYIGNTAKDSYILTINEQDALLMPTGFHLPKALVSGQKFVLPLPDSYDYSGDGAVAVKPSVSATLDGQSLPVQDGVIMPVISAESGKVSLTYTYTSQGLSSQYTYEVPVVNVNASDGLAMERYFIADMFTVTPLVDSIQFATNTSNAEFCFFKSVQAKSFSLEFSTDATLINVSYIDFVMTDKTDKNVSISVRLNSNGTMSVNGGDTKAVYSLPNGEKRSYAINYNNETKSFSDLGGTVFGIAEKTLRGEPFTGFTSDEIFFSVRMGTVNGSANTFITKINGQIITRATRDVVAPQIFIDSELGGMRNINDKIVVLPVQAYDVLGYVKAVTVSVMNSSTREYVKTIDGTTLQNVDATKTYEFVIEKYGTYNIIVTATDSNNRESTTTKIMFVSDTQAPTIVVNGKIPEKAAVNSSVSLPSMSVTDNISASEDIISYIVVFDPNGFGKICTDAFIPELTGTYYVRYMAMDENNQIAMQEYKIVVS